MYLFCLGRFCPENWIEKMIPYSKYKFWCKKYANWVIVSEHEIGYFNRRKFIIDPLQRVTCNTNQLSGNYSV